MRRPVTLYLLLLCLLCVASCHRRPTYPSSLLRADSLADANATEALSLLHQLETDTATWSGAARMYHQLLTVKAQDKAYIPHTSDSVMLPILHYYEHGGDKDLLPTAYYYMGSTYRDLNDAPRALEYYQKALDVIPGDNYLKVKTKVYAQMGDLLYYQNLYQNALKQYNESYRCNSILNDTVGLIFNLCDMALCYANTNMNKEGITYLKQAIHYAEAIDDEEMYSLASSQLSSLYEQIGDYTSAYESIKPALANLDSTNISSVYSIAASVHRHLGNRDSAFYYYSKLLKYGNLYARTEANYQLAKIAEDSLHLERAVTLLEKYRHLADFVKYITSTEAIARMNSLYDYQVHEREKAEAQNKANRFRLYLVTGFAFFVIVSLVLISLVQYYKRKELKSKVRLEKLSALRMEEHRRSREYIRENEEKMVSLSMRISELEDSETQLKAQLQNTKDQLMLENQVAEAKMRQREQALKAILASPLRAELISKAEMHNHLRDEDILSIETLLNANFPHFIEDLLGLGDLSAIEYKVCLLLKMKIAPKHIKILVNREKTSISNIRSRLYEKITGMQGSTKDWDALINNI